MLVMLDETGNVITLDGRLAVNEDREGQVGVQDHQALKTNLFQNFCIKKTRKKSL